MKRAKSVNFSTVPQNPSDRFAASLILAGVVALQIGLLSAPFWWPVPMDCKQLNVCWIVAPCSIVILAGLLLKHRIESPCGTFRIDGQGVEFVPIRGRRRSLNWADISRVYWPLAWYQDSFRGIILRGRRSTIRIPFETIAEPDLAAAVPFIAECLAPSFDLSERHVWFHGVFPSEHCAFRLFRAAGIGVVVFGGLILIMALGIMFWPNLVLWTAPALLSVTMIALLHEQRSASWRRRQISTSPEDLWPLE